jgi:tRNA-dihydrouridine synthase
MKFYMAPLEGVTTYPLRAAHHGCFPGTDRYYTPFISTGKSFLMKKRDCIGILPENNEGIELVPQLLTNDAVSFLRTAETIMTYGWREINLNLGCPYNTVAAKKRGSGFLKYPDELDRFFDTLFQKAEADSPAGIRISVKTRIGVEDVSEAAGLMRIYNRYPIAELTIHPRLRSEMYSGEPHLDVFGEMLAVSRNPVCYNGDINTADDFRRLTERFPDLQAVMIGRGLIRYPGLVRELQGGAKASKAELVNYYHEVLRRTAAVLPDENSRMQRMKEFWKYFGRSFAGSDGHLLDLLKAKNYAQYQGAVEVLLSCHDAV